MYSNQKIIGTHNGIFHEDDVLAVSLLSILYDDNISIKRTRDVSILTNCDIVVDVGGGKYDHHMPGDIKVRENGVPYASAGLIWKDFGIDILEKFDNSLKNYAGIAKTIDNILLQPVDKKDNGIKSISPLSYVESFLPTWNDDKTTFDLAFIQAVQITKRIVKKIIEQELATSKARILIQELINEKKDYYNIIELPCQNIPWKEMLTTHNLLMEFDNNKEFIEKYTIAFVVFPHPDGGYAAQCVPLSEDTPFSQHIPFPKKWSGLTTTLPEISGVPNSTFCHVNCFFVRAKTKQAAIDLCKKATELYCLESI